MSSFWSQRVISHHVPVAILPLRMLFGSKLKQASSSECHSKHPVRPVSILQRSVCWSRLLLRSSFSNGCGHGRNSQRGRRRRHAVGFIWFWQGPVSHMFFVSVLSHDAFAALQDFYSERDQRQQRLDDLKSRIDQTPQIPLSMEMFSEDWNASQFWVFSENMVVRHCGILMGSV